MQRKVYIFADISPLLTISQRRSASHHHHCMLLFLRWTFLRACLKRSRSSQSAQHQTSHSDVNHRFAAAWQDFIILAQTPTLGQPGEGALDDPATLPPQTVFCFCVLAIAYSFRDSLV